MPGGAGVLLKESHLWAVIPDSLEYSTKKTVANILPPGSFHHLPPLYLSFLGMRFLDCATVRFLRSRAGLLRSSTFSGVFSACLFFLLHKIHLELASPSFSQNHPLSSTRDDVSGDIWRVVLAFRRGEHKDLSQQPYASSFLGGNRCQPW